jgi:hypothetical protein
VRTRNGTEVEVISIYRRGTIWVKVRRLEDGEIRRYPLLALVGGEDEVKKLISQFEQEDLKVIEKEAMTKERASEEWASVIVKARLWAGVILRLARKVSIVWDSPGSYDEIKDKFLILKQELNEEKRRFLSWAKEYRCVLQPDEVKEFDDIVEAVTLA